VTAATSPVRSTVDAAVTGEESSVFMVLSCRVLAVILARWSGVSSCVISDCFRFCPKLRWTELRALCCRDDTPESRLEERVDRCKGVSTGPLLSLGEDLVGRVCFGVAWRGVGSFGGGDGGGGSAVLKSGSDGGSRGGGDSCGRVKPKLNPPEKAVVLESWPVSTGTQVPSIIR